jgi:N-acyl-D-amino-acid deacylase
MRPDQERHRQDRIVITNPGGLPVATPSTKSHCESEMTGAPARVLGLLERGLLREGYWADITTFDPATIIDRATYADPHRYPRGIGTVVVNGTIVVDSGQHTGTLPGRVLRRGPAGLA